MEKLDEDFLSELTGCQNQLFAYLVTLLGNVHDTRDVLQETNLVMWRRVHTFTPGTNFEAWSRRCAYLQALAFLRDRKRSPNLLSEEALELIAGEEDSISGDENERVLALRDCLGRLNDKQRELIKCRYEDRESVKALPAMIEKKESATKMLLMRIREKLQVCIMTKLKESNP